MNIKDRLDRLEEKVGRRAPELLIRIKHCYSEGDPEPNLPDPEEEIARQRAERKKVIAVHMPYGIKQTDK